MSQDIYSSPEADLGTNDAEYTSLTMKEILFSFKGRVGRKTYWLTLLAAIGIYFVSAAVLGAIGLPMEVLMALFVLAYIPLIWISLAVQVKRWHDRNKSGWWVLIAFVPLIGPIWQLVENGFLAGDPSPNNYGPPNR